MKLALATTLVTLSALAVPVAPAAAVPPKGARVVATAADAQPAPAWVEADYLEVPSEGRPARLALRVSMSPKGAIRQDIQDLGPRASLSTQIWAPIGAAPAGAAALDEAPGWLQVLSGRPLAAVLRAKDVDADKTSFAHDGPTILWVLGAGPHDSEAAQIRVERATGRLRRFTEIVLGPAATDGGPPVRQVVTVRLAGAAAKEGAEAAWPARIEVESAGRTVAFALRELTIGQPLDPDRFRAELPEEPAPPAPPEQPATPAPGPDPGGPGATL